MAEHKPHAANVPGDFYVEDGCCTMCKVPFSEAPDLFGTVQDLKGSNAGRGEDKMWIFVILGVGLGSLLLCCRWPVALLSDRLAATERLDTVVVGSITETGDLERKYNRIERGMNKKDAETILGRSSDDYVFPGGSVGDEECYWFEDKAVIVVDFECGSGKVCRKTLIRRNTKQQ